MPRSKKMPPLPFAAEQAIVFALEGNPSSLTGKLQAIYKAASALIFYSEQAQEVAIKNAWGVNAEVLEKQSLDLRVARRKLFINATNPDISP